MKVTLTGVRSPSRGASATVSVAPAQTPPMLAANATLPTTWSLFHLDPHADTVPVWGGARHEVPANVPKIRVSIQV